jgi:hypothetical protein
MRWRKRIKQWIAVLRQTHGEGVKIPWWGLVLAVWSGPVPRQVWRARIRYGCYQCPVYNRELRRCRPDLPGYEEVGCGCYLPFSALTAQPYPKGCWAKQVDDPELGWAAYVWPSRWHKWRAVICFILDIRY